MRSLTTSAPGAISSTLPRGLSATLATAPRYLAIASFVYLVSPLNAFILFRHTDWLQNYPDRSDLALAAAPAVVLAAAAAVALLLRDGPGFLRRALESAAGWGVAILLAAALVGAGIGWLRHNSGALIVSDLLPMAELALFFYLGRFALDPQRDLVPLLGLTAVTLCTTLAIKFIFFWEARDQLPVLAHNYTHGFFGDGITALFVIQRIMPRLPLLQPTAWLAPFFLAYALFGTAPRRRLVAAGAAAIMAVGAYLSFERGLWVFLAVGTAAVLLEALRRRTRPPWRAAGAGLAVLLAGYGLMAALISAEPATTGLDRLGYTLAQLRSGNPLQHKRQDEATSITSEVTVTGPVPVSILGSGLGATYLGPTGSLDTNYVQLQRSTKHYTYNTYLAVVLRMGLMGLAALTAFVLCYLWTGWSAWRRLPDGWPRAAPAAAVGCLLGVAGMSYVDPYLLAHPITMFEGLTLGLLVAATRQPLPRPGR